MAASRSEGTTEPKDDGSANSSILPTGMKMKIPELPSMKAAMPEFPSWLPAPPPWMSMQSLKAQLPTGPWKDLPTEAEAQGMFKGTVTQIRDNRLALGAALTSVILIQPYFSPYRAKALIRNVVFLGGAGFCVLCPAYALALGQSIKRDALLDSAISAFPPLQKLSFRWPEESQPDPE
mmetsp:Transcript_40653/g.95566  ORF Transcript_40653/g.95566 Transcript_40653/m.95566 type:complete len:178 (+) Transcript_40653:1-534(+)